MLEDKCLLLIEDDDAYGETVSYLFDTFAPSAVFQWVRSLASALEAIRAIRYDVVILDLFLPDARDLVALNTLVERIPDTTIIILTGHGEYRVEGLAAGATAYLLKTDAIGEDLIREIDRIVSAT